MPFALALLCIAAAVKFFTLGGSDQNGPPPGRLLVMSFLAGVVFHLHGDRIRLNAWQAAISGVLAVALLADARTAYLALFPATYLTVYLGLLNPPKRTFLMRGDYSYGLYLFAFPIQQAHVMLFPGQREWWINTAVALVLGLAYASASWHFVEHPILRRKKSILAVVDRLGAQARKVFAQRAANGSQRDPTLAREVEP